MNASVGFTPKKFCLDANSSKRGFPEMQENPLTQRRRALPAFPSQTARQPELQHKNSCMTRSGLTRSEAGHTTGRTGVVRAWTTPETPAALWLRHVLDDEIEPLYQELRKGRAAAVPTLFLSVVGRGAFPFILLFLGLYAIAMACMLLVY